METPNPATPNTPKPAPQSSSPFSSSSSSSPSAASSSSSSRLWRPSAQRNMRNQWSKLSSLRREWATSSSNGRARAASLVNSYLNLKYMPSMELGALSDTPDIRNKASNKLFKQQELQRSNLLSSYKDMVSVVTNMIKTSKSLKCFLKGSGSSSFIQYSAYSDYDNDRGDGGGIPVFTFWSIFCFEKVAEELVHMFIMELNLKRMLVVELLSISCKRPVVNCMQWEEELYPGEYGDLSICNLLSEETCKPVYPRSHGRKSDKPATQCNKQPDQDVLEVCLTTWQTEVNIDSHRVDEIFAEVGEEVHFRFP